MLLRCILLEAINLPPSADIENTLSEFRLFLLPDTVRDDAQI